MTPLDWSIKKHPRYCFTETLQMWRTRETAPSKTLLSQMGQQSTEKKEVLSKPVKISSCQESSGRGSSALFGSFVQKGAWCHHCCELKTLSRQMRIAFSVLWENWWYRLVLMVSPVSAWDQLSILLPAYQAEDIFIFKTPANIGGYF